MSQLSENPMYLRPHSKSILHKSIRDDTAFLSSNLVMDYSLLVGVDEANHELVIGKRAAITGTSWNETPLRAAKDLVLITCSGVVIIMSHMHTPIGVHLCNLQFTRSSILLLMRSPDCFCQSWIGHDVNTPVVYSLLNWNMDQLWCHWNCEIEIYAFDWIVTKRSPGSLIWKKVEETKSLRSFWVLQRKTDFPLFYESFGKVDAF